MITYLQAVSVIENFATQNEMVQKFGFEFKEQMPNIATEDERYPLLFVVPIGAMPTTNTNEFEIDIYCLDRYTQDRVNVPSVVSDTQLILAMLTKWLEEGQTDMDVIHSYPMLPINNDLLDYCGGWVMRVRVEVDMVSICEIPLSGVEPTPPTPCDDATQVITDSEGNQLYSNSIPSGATETQPIQDSSVTVNTLLFADVLAEGSLNVPVVNSGDNPIGSIVGGEVVVANSVININATQVGDVPAEDTLSISVELDGTPSGTWNAGTQTWEVTSEPCAPVDVYVGEANVGSFPSGSDVFVTVTQDGFEVIPESVTVTDDEIDIILADTPDTTIQVNGTTEGTFNAGSTVDVQLSDSGGVVTPDSVTIVGNDLQIVLPDCVGGSVGATLMKTGQTTSYRTGDDGDIEAGRATDFFTLASNNPFGNTNRFTDELGGQTYTNNIVIDWSTYNGSTVSGYTKNTNGSAVTWNTAVDNCLLLSISTFTSGWRLTNRNELSNLINEGTATGVLNYPPFNFTTDVNIWSSTTARYDTSRAFILGSNSTGWVYALPKSSASCHYYAVRTFTVTGTTLS